MLKKYVLGIDAGGTKVAFGLFESNGSLVYRMEYPTEIVADGPTFCDSLIEAVNSILKENNLTIKNLNGIGICMPSFIHFDKGYVLMTSAMVNIKHFPMKEYLEERLNIPIVLDNDCNVAALAELRHGAGRGAEHMVYMATSTGIGSGLIINGELFRGSYGWAGESGHMLATPDEGTMCGCQNKGCYMSYASGRYIPKYLKQRLEQGAESMLSIDEEITCKQILDAFYKDDELASEVVERMAHYLAVCVFNIYQLLNINLFVFGGGLVNFGECLFDRVRQEFDEYNHIPLDVKFEFAELKKDFGIVGAAELIEEIQH